MRARYSEGKKHVGSGILPARRFTVLDKRLPWFLFAVIFFVTLFGWWRGYAGMPERLASHFDAAGAPNGWMSKDQFFTLNSILAGLAVFIGLFPPLLIAKLSPSLINLPNKNYWLAPEHRDETIAFFERWFGWFACAFLLFLALVMQMVIESNRSATPQLPSDQFMYLLVGFLLFTGVWVFLMVWKFSRTG